MKIIIHVTLLWGDSSNPNRGHCGGVQKEFECTVIPIPGMEIEVEAWDEPREITGVILNLDEDNYYIEFSDICPTEEDCKRTKERYISLGWKKP